MHQNRFRHTLLALLSVLPLLLLAACATAPTDPAARAQYDANNDPLEPLNRQILSANLFVDRYTLQPLARAYRAVAPEFVRLLIRNFLSNLHEPVIFANNAVQTEFVRAGWTAERFVINSTVGVGGLFDIAARWGIDQQSGDFGQTLYHYGIGEGLYLMLPILGPSNPRDTVGFFADGLADPFGYLAYDYGADVATYARWGMEGLDQREQYLDPLDALQRNAIDLYAEIRSLYRQHRQTELNHGTPPAPSQDMDSLYKDPDSK